ncbi:MAG: DNA-binding response regulator [Actinobacteria bacterium]|nr:DNA-binding response regulator [Actinomycetota bacterium]
MSRLVLVVDDDPGVLELVEDALTIAGMDTTTAIDGLEALNLIRERQFDIVIADVNMPKLDGLELLRNLRERGNQIPFVFLTARNQKLDLSHGFRSGADDYLTKPFSIEELVLRINAVLRRTTTQQPKGMEFGRMLISPDEYSVKIDGHALELSPTEYRLLLSLANASPRVCSKNMLLDEVWGMGFSNSVSVVDTYISYLRKKLQQHSFNGIKTVRGFGFKLEAD